MAEKPESPGEANEDEVIPLPAGESDLETLPEESTEAVGPEEAAWDVGEDVTVETVDGDVMAESITLVSETKEVKGDAFGSAGARPVDIIADEEELLPTAAGSAGQEQSAADTVELPEATDTPAAGADKSSWKDRLGGVFGRATSPDAGSGESEVEAGPDRPAASATTLIGLRAFFDPGMNGIDTRLLRYTVGGAALMMLVLLLANQAGGALILASAVVPILVVMLLTSHDVFERESNLLLAGVGAAGVVSGLLVGGIGAWVTRAQWIDAGHLNFGAGGFGGRFAPGAAPFLVWLMVGILLPAAMVAGLAAAPLLLRRWPQFANEVMDGMILAGASAAGLAIGLSTVFWWPMVFGDGPLMDVRDWTLTIVGQAFLRPLVITLSGALIGAGVWRYMLNTAGSFLLLLPAAAGVLGLMALWIGSLARQPGGIWPEFLLVMAVAALIFVTYRRALDLAVETDRAAVGTTGDRIICPACHQVTPIGAFCARCGAPLPPSSHPEA